MKKAHRRKTTHGIDPLALPLVPPRSKQIPQGGSFIRDRERGAGQVAQELAGQSLLRRAGHR